MPLDYKPANTRTACVPAEPALLAGTIELQRQLVFEYEHGRPLEATETIRRVPWCVRTDCVQPEHLRAQVTHPHQRLTPKDRAEIVRTLRSKTDGLTAHDLAERFRCSTDTIYRVIRQHQDALDLSDTRRKRAAIRDTLLARLAYDYDPTSRETMAPALATAYHVSVSTVFQAIKRFNVTKDEDIAVRRLRLLAECADAGIEIQ